MAFSNRIPEYFSLSKYNVSPSNIAIGTLRCDLSLIKEDVIVTPVWNPDIFSKYVESDTTIVEGSIHELRYKKKAFTLIQSGIGAPQTGDVILALGCTKCKRIIFTGSVGGLNAQQSVGDLIIEQYAISGDGFSRYLSGNVWKAKSFTKAYPDRELYNALNTISERVNNGNQLTIHQGIIFSTDALIPQFMYLDEIIKKYGCIGIEMETSAVFNAAQIVGIQAAAILQVSDVSVINKSLFSGRTEEDQLRRKEIRKDVLAKIVIDTLMGNLKIKFT
jgi:purine-nucleoside phosphorylase